MNMQARIWLVISFLILAVGVVYALSTTTPVRTAPDKIEKPQQAVTAPAQPSAPPAETTVASEPVESLSPDLTQVNAFEFLDPVPEGHKAPDFATKTADGKAIRMADFIGKKNVVLVFYQGSFCGVCGAQLANIQKHLSDFKAQDAEVIAISADDQQHAMQTLGENGLAFNIVPNAEKDIIRKFGVANISKHNIAWPALFVVDKKGIVQLSYASAEGHRMHSNEILPVLSKITGKPAPKLDYYN